MVHVRVQVRNPPCGSLYLIRLSIQCPAAVGGNGRWHGAITAVPCAEARSDAGGAPEQGARHAMPCTHGRTIRLGVTGGKNVASGRFAIPVAVNGRSMKQAPSLLS